MMRRNNSYNKRIKKIKNSITIDEVIDHLQLEREGQKISSPYSSDTTFSCHIFSDTNTFKCFSTGKSGDQIQLYMDIKKISLLKAISKLLELCRSSVVNKKCKIQKGNFSKTLKSNNVNQFFKKERESVKIDYSNVFFCERKLYDFLVGENLGSETKALTELLEIRKINQSKIFQFVYEVCSKQIIPDYVINYLSGNQRKLKEQTIYDSRIFYISNPSELVRLLRAKFNQYELKISGLFGKGEYFLLNRHRLIIPFSRTGSTRAPSESIEYLRGRYLEESGSEPPIKTSKYIGLSNKSLTFSTKRFYTPYDYNGENEIMIVEGEFDTLVGCQLGIYTMGILGVANIDENMINKLHGMKNIYVCFDNDEAGRNGVQRLANKYRRSVNSIILKKHKDLTDWYEGQTYPVWEDPDVEVVKVNSRGGE